MHKIGLYRRATEIFYSTGGTAMRMMLKFTLPVEKSNTAIIVDLFKSLVGLRPRTSFSAVELGVTAEASSRPTAGQ